MSEEDDGTLTTSQLDASAVQMSSTDYGRLSIEDLGLIVRLDAEGRTQRQIAAVIECSQASVSYALKRFQTSQHDVQTLLKADALSHVSNWKKASDKAADRGDHRPAREALEAAYPELRPQPVSAGAGGGVTIHIGMPGQPIALPVIEVRAEPLSPTNPPALGEGPQNPSANRAGSHNGA